ncbi:hypothetical protein UFOVP1288_7 [uncultured Caudovirales phage]|uniref:Uncharacterized protein n=1 Tax=uncultured Caudovirales phage TaxID=2100421 RepID=A0A6J5R0L5_9CAUD|nr:hypothetical protein UFOVP1195_7 [uncultured Caudovirales phage]CAB4195319.1 hypothetical protein UFOVP1288_7 [uncultured Caudovirales phage]CAB4204908.1 hypothetical protein UFOVP1409_7 [uncultured Caudovirales phage]
MKAIITLGYVDYVLDTEDALRIVEVLGNAELYKADWSTEGTAHYIYPVSEGVADGINHDLPVNNLRFLSEERYRLAKLAGKPPKKAF